MGGEVVHFEIPLDNVDRGHRFYKAAFGWELSLIPEMDYAMVQTTESDEQGIPKHPGSINGGMAKRAEPLHYPTVTIMVDDIVATEKVIEKNGGKVVRKRIPIGDGSMGFTGYFKDTEGNLIGLFERPKG
ncbi:MAG: VOC family protein [Thermoplasmata archaeon]|nr:VOC family protein [Thermoplasmata archaeon]